MKKSILLACITSIGLIGCDGSNDSNNNATDKSPATQEKLSFSFKDTSEGEPEYLISKEDIMSGTISAQGVGTEQLGWNFFYPVGNTIFISGYQNFDTSSYRLNEAGDTTKLNTFLYDKPLQSFGRIGDQTLIASDAPGAGHTDRKFYTVDANSGLVKSIVEYTIHGIDNGTAGLGTVAWPTGLLVRDNKLFIPFQKLDDAGGYYTPDADTAFIAVYDYPLTPSNNTPTKIIEDPRTTNIGVNGSTTNIIQADNGDIYTMSNGGFTGGFAVPGDHDNKPETPHQGIPATTKPSGILRIANATTEFDASYFFNVEEAASGKIFWFDYLGGNKAIARIVTDEAGYWWSAFYKDYYTTKLVMLDLANKTSTDIEGIPLHQKRYTSPLEIIDGHVYLSIETATDSHVYKVNIETSEATKGAKIEGKTIKGFYDLNN